MWSSTGVSRGRLSSTKPLSAWPSPCWATGISLASTPVTASATSAKAARASGGPGRRNICPVHGTHAGSREPEANPEVEMAPPVPGLIPSLHDAPLRDRDGLLVGRAHALLCDAVTHRPAWYVVGLAD